MKHKKLFISLTAVAAVIVFLGIFLLIWFVGDSYKDFKRFKQEFAIEGLDEGAVPQGMTTYYSTYPDGDENGVDDKGNKLKQQYFLVSSYMKDNSPSRIYVSGEKTGYIGYVTMRNEDDSLHYGHVGGIATNGAYLWVGYNDSVLVARASTEKGEDGKALYENILREIINKAWVNKNGEAEETQSIKFTASFKANCNASFIGYFDDARYSDTSYDRLYVGEFYRDGNNDNYKTSASHHLKTPNGYKNSAFMYEYNVDRTSASTNPYGLTRLDSANTNEKISDNVPKIQKIFSIPEKIQGVAFSGRKGSSTTSSDTDAMIVLSQSYGLANSHLLCFDWKLINETANRVYYRTVSGGNSFEYEGVYKTSASGKQTPYTDSGLYVYYLDMNDGNMFVNDYSIPSMSEAMCTVTKEGSTNADAVRRIYVLFESGSKKYNMFTRESIKNVYSFEPTK